MDKPFITTIITIIVTMLQAEIMYNVHNLISVASANPVNPLWLGQNSSFCIKTMWMIICDYKWREELVLLDSRHVGKNEVILMNIHRLTIDRSICTDLHLRNVADARVNGQPSTSCSRINALLQNVTLDLLGDPVTKAHVMNSKIREIRLQSLKDQLTIISSSIGVLKVGEVSGNASVKVQNTSITRLESLNIRESEKMLFDDCVINEVSPSAMVLSSRNNIFSKVRFSSTHDRPMATLVLDPGAAVTLENLSGETLVNCSAFSTFPEEPPHVTDSICPTRLPHTPDHQFYFWTSVIQLIIIILVLIFISLRKILKKCLRVASKIILSVAHNLPYLGQPIRRT
ncbi:uncharacterized protein [Cherax quadricarinatus]|uniref:uncharacterized protein n=1 Tax=Cherax quadricarinatus TaxID=27406 RepID=UPI00387E2605